MNTGRRILVSVTAAACLLGAAALPASAATGWQVKVGDRIVAMYSSRRDAHTNRVPGSHIHRVSYSPATRTLQP